MSALNISLTGDLTSGLDSLEKAAKEKVLIAGVAQMARVIYGEVKINVGRIGRKTGNLDRGVYRYYSPRRSTEFVKTYFVGVNHRKAPHWHLIEYGHWHRQFRQAILINGKWVTLKRPMANAKQTWIPPKPFIRPAFDHVQRAIASGSERMRTVFSESVKQIGSNVK